MKRYRADIDGLRAIAILLVVVFHFDIFSAGKAGFIGVDIFLVISGFLITGIIAQDIDARRFSFMSFLYRRVRRLYPAMIATLILYSLIAYWIFLPDLFAELAIETILSQVYVVNIYFWQTVNYFGLPADFVPLLHMWSLSIEEQFYLFFPMFFVLTHKLWPRGMLSIISILVVVSFALGLFASGWKPIAAFYLLPTRAWELLIGSALALILRQGFPADRYLRFLGPLGLSLIIIALIIYTPATPMPGWFALLPTLGAVALLLGGTQEQALVTRMLSNPVMVWIGKISYPLYLVHWPVQIVLKDVLQNYNLPWRVAGLLVSISIAGTVYALIERPIRQGRVLVHPKKFLISYGAVTGLLLAASAIVVITEGLPGRFSAEVNIHLAGAKDTADKYQFCEFDNDPSFKPCRLGVADQPASIMILGDSHGRALAEALDIWLKDSDKGAIFAFSHSCLPTRNSGADRCIQYTDTMLDAAEITPTINEVILVSSWSQAYEGDGMQIGQRWLPKEAAAQSFSDALSDTVVRLTDNGKRVILIEPLFAASRSVPQTLARNAAFGTNWTIDVPLMKHQNRFQQLFIAFDRAEEKGAMRISLIDKFCVDGICKAQWNGKPVFSDNSHLAFGMSPVVAKILAQQMNSLK